jgi:hypothetical protein
MTATVRSAARATAVKSGGRKGLIATVGVVIAAAFALLLGDAHSIGMTHN